MFSYGHGRALVLALTALSCLLWGIFTMGADAARSQLQEVSIEALEAGEKLASRQYVSIRNAFVLPSYWVHGVSQGRGRSQLYEVFLPVGSAAMLHQASQRVPVEPVVWVRQPELHAEYEGASASARSLLRAGPVPVEGVLGSPPPYFRVQADEPHVRVDSPDLVNHGRAPGAYRFSSFLIHTGLTGLLVVGLWAWSARSAKRWLALRCPPGAQAFSGRSFSMWWLGVASLALMAAGGGGVAVGIEHTGVPGLPALAATAAGAVLFALASWRGRVGVVLSGETLNLHEDGDMRGIALANVKDVSVRSSNPFRLALWWECVYTLQGPDGSFRIGSGPSDSGLHAPEQFDAALRAALALRGMSLPKP